MLTYLRNATALALVAGLVAPGPSWAQDLPDCEEGVDLPCATVEGNAVETEEALRLYLENIETGEAPVDPEEAPVEGDMVVDTPAAGAEGGADAAAEAEPAQEPEEATPAGDGEADEAGEEAAAELAEMPEQVAPPAEEAAVPEEPAEVPEPEMTESPAEPEVLDDAADPVATESPAEADEPVATEAPAAGGDSVATESPVEAADPVVTEAPAEPAAPEATEAPADAAAPEATEPPAARPESEAVEAPVIEERDPAPEDTVETDIPAVESEVPDAAEPPLAAAATEAEELPPAEVDEITVTDDMARSSAEEFQTAVGEQVPAATAEGDDGPTRLEKALALGIGAAVLGTILQQGSEVVANTGDRLVVQQPDGELRVIRDDDVLLRQPGAQVRSETFDDGSTRTTVSREDGVRIVTIRSADGEVLRRTRILPDGERIVLYDQTRQFSPVDTAELPAPTQDVFEYTGDEVALRRALAATAAQDLGRNFSLRQIREIRAVRELASEIEIDAITFPTGSAAIQPSQARELSALGRTLAAIIEENPGEVFLVEGHTDAVGDASYNLALSDRRAESVALALVEYFDVPPENLVVQGYGESDLKVPTAGAEVENRRANVRRITGLLGMETAGLR